MFGILKQVKDENKDFLTLISMLHVIAITFSSNNFTTCLKYFASEKYFIIHKDI